MRQFKMLAAGFVLMFAAAGSVRGGDNDFNAWTDDLSWNARNKHLHLPPMFDTPVADLTMPLFITTGAREYRCDIGCCSIVNCGTANCCVGKCGKQCEATDKCEALDPATAAFIAEHRQNSPAARFCESLDIPCMLGGCEKSDGIAGYAAACSSPTAAPTIVAVPGYAHPPVYVHPPICAPQAICPQPMPLAYRPGCSLPGYNCAPPAYPAPANPYSPGYAYAASTGCGQSNCKCESCNCGSNCKCGAAGKCGAGCNCGANLAGNCPHPACNFCGAKACPCQTAACQCNRANSEECDAAQQRLEHMLEASRHLELAGMKDQAHELRERCMAEVGKLARRLKAAEAELAQLRKSASGAKTVHRDVPAANPCSFAPDAACCQPSTEQGKQVVVEIQMLEIDRNKLRSLGFDIGSPTGEATSCSTVQALTKAASKSCGASGCSDTCCGVLNDAKGLMGFLKALQQEGIVKVLSDPTVTAVSGRAASFQIGGEFPVPSGDGKSLEYRTFGTELNLVPIITDGNKLRLEVRARHSELDESRDVQVAGHTIPGLRVSQVDTGVEMKSGQTCVLGGMISNRADGDKQAGVELLMIIKPEIVVEPKCATACKTTPGAKCECAPCGNCQPASHAEAPLVPMPSF